ncbi:hypothetical protein FACS189435_3940 [Bacteroidia bacterium]|nr:hypothetical protein FACS189435_3940 [Bacteroidia bacterium]
MKKIFLLLAVAMLYVPGSRAVDVSATVSCGNGLEWTLGLEDSLSVEPGVPARTVLFKLGDNEEIYVGEYFLEQLQNQNRFACVVLDTITDNLSFIFNGKRITSGPGTGNYWGNSGGWVGRGCEVYYIDLSEDNGYIVHYREKVAGSDEKYIHYINYKGVVSGPFDAFEYKNDSVYLFAKKDEGSEKLSIYINYKGVVGGPFDNIYYDPGDYDVYTPEDNYDYLYELAGRWYAHKNGKNKRIDFISTNGRTGVYTSGRRDEYVNINGKERSKPHSRIRSIKLTKSGIYAYAYQDEYEGKWYANINGKVGEPHEQIWNINLTESGIYAYEYRDNGKWYANINGKVSEPHEQIENIKLTKSGIYAYEYRDNGKWYANINGKVSEPHEYIASINLIESGIYAYVYRDNGKYYANINGKVGEPHEYIWSLSVNLTESGIYTYVYRNNGKDYVNRNGKVELYSESKRRSDGTYVFIRIGWFSNNPNNELDVSTPDEEHTFYSSFEYEYVVIDGKRYCDSPAIQAWFDNKKNAFVWNAVEGRELVVYEFKLD